MSTQDIKNLITKLAPQYGIDPDFALRVAKQESGFNPNAKSPVGAGGVFQLMPGTAVGLGVKNIYDPEQNIIGGLKYLKQGFDAYGGDKVKTLVRYNAGPGGVQKYNKTGKIPYAETRNYVNSILGGYTGTGLFSSDKIAAKPATPQETVIDKVVKSISSPVTAKPITQKPITNITTKPIQKDIGTSSMNNLGYLGALPTLGNNALLNRLLMQNNPTGAGALINGGINQQGPPLPPLIQSSGIGIPPMPPRGINAFAPNTPIPPLSQYQLMNGGGAQPVMRPQGQLGMPDMSKESALKQKVEKNKKEGFNKVPLQMALTGLGNNLMALATQGKVTGDKSAQQYASDKDLQTQRDELAREKMKFDEEQKKLDRDLEERKFSSTKEYQDKLLALQEKEFGLKETELKMEIEALTGLNVTGKSSDSVLQMLSLKNNPNTWSALTPDVQNKMDEYLNLKIKEAGKMFTSEFAGKQGAEMGKLKGQTGIEGATVETVETMKQSGKDLAASQQQYSMMVSKMPTLEKTVDKLNKLAEAATYTKAGQFTNEVKRQLGVDVGNAAVARKEYESTVNNQILPLLRQTFGAQFTEREGQTLRETLGDINASPTEKKAVLKAFIEQKRKDVEDAQRMIQIQQGGNVNNDPLGLF